MRSSAVFAGVSMPTVDSPVPAVRQSRGPGCGRSLAVHRPSAHESASPSTRARAANCPRRRTGIEVRGGEETDIHSPEHTGRSDRNRGGPAGEGRRRTRQLRPPRQRRAVVVDHAQRSRQARLRIPRLDVTDHRGRPSPTARPRAIHLGAAGAALARALDARRPGSRQTAIDIDPVLIEHVRTWFALPRSPALARAPGTPPRRSRPSATTPPTSSSVTRSPTTPFPRACRPRGSMPNALASCAPQASSSPMFPIPATIGLARAELEAAGSAFSHVAAASESGVLKGRRRGNVVVAAAQEPLPDSALDRSPRTAATMARWLSAEEPRARFGR